MDEDDNGYLKVLCEQTGLLLWKEKALGFLMDNNLNVYISMVDWV